jgi:two-component system chemotaxis response regulator CheY
MPGTLLITDDAMIIREMIKDVVSPAGWSVVGEAANGKQAVERYLDLRPDVVTLDLVMPEFDGLYALRGIRAADPDARILVLSALDQTPVLKEAFALGASDFICKPFEREALLQTLETLYEAGLCRAGEYPDA